MVRLCSTRLLITSIALLTFGCSGQNLEGRWRGSLPLEDAKACVTNLRANNRFDTYCEGKTWIGGGRYKASSTSLRLDFEVLTHQGDVVRHPAPILLEMEGKGNILRLWTDARSDQSFEWVRRMGGD